MPPSPAAASLAASAVTRDVQARELEERPVRELEVLLAFAAGKPNVRALTEQGPPQVEQFGVPLADWYGE